MSPAAPPVKATLLARASAVFAIFVACTVLVGWQYDIERFKSLLLNLAAMNPATAVTFGVAGTTLICLTSKSRRLHRLANILAAAMASLGFLKMGGIFGWWQYDFDTLLFTEKVNHQFWNGSVNRMAPVTALAFTSLGFAILLRTTWARYGAPLTQTLLSFQALLALVAIVSYLYGARSLTDFGGYLPMTLPTSLTFMVLTFGTICAIPECGVMRLLVNSGEAGHATQRLLLGGITAPLVLGWVTLHGQQANLYSPLVAVAIFCVLATLCFGFITLWHGFMLLHMQVRRMAGEEALKESEERFRMLSDSAFEALVISVDGRVKDVNQEFCRIFGYTYQEVVGMRSTDFVSIEFKATVAAKIAEESDEIYQAQGQRKDGSLFDIEIWGRPIPLRGERGRVTAIRDITERRRVERMKDEFVSVVNHELRTPLTSIHGALGLMANGMTGALPGAAPEMVDVALRNTRRLLSLVNDLLDVQKIEAGEMRFHLSEIDINLLVAANMQAIYPYAEGLHVKFKANYGTTSVMVFSDSDRLTQVLTNLFSNAAKFSPPQGIVSVNVFPIVNKVRVEVRDNGAGIPIEFQDRVFEKFSQADSSATRQAGGTGLGLSICKSIMEKLGGTIGFTTDSSGTTFYIELPVNAEDPNKANPHKQLLAAHRES